jgi:hypothetical protein
LLSRATPTTVNHSCVKSEFTRLPNASCAGQYRFANASLTIVARCEFLLSCGVKSRPFASGISIV